MKEFFKNKSFITKLAIIVALILSLLSLTGCVNVCITENEYEYIDMFGNSGTSDNCYYGGYRAGGLYCGTEEDNMIQVSQFKLIESKSVCE